MHLRQPLWPTNSKLSKLEWKESKKKMSVVALTTLASRAVETRKSGVASSDGRGASLVEQSHLSSIDQP